MLVIIPAYKEKMTIATLIEDVGKTTSVTEIILVNDSPTPEFIEYYNSLSFPKLRVIHHDVNKGKDMAIRTALDNSRQENIVILDADLQNVRPQQLERINVLLQEYDVIPMIRGEDEPWARFVGSTYMMLGEHAFRRSFIEIFKDILFTDIRWTLDNEMNSIVLSGKVKAKYVELAGVSHTRKSEKYGLVTGLLHDAKMILEVIFIHYKVFGFIIQRIQIEKFLKEKEILSS